MTPKELVVKKLGFKPPFHLCPYEIYVYDSASQTIGDFSGPEGTFRTRGWGRIQQLPDGNNLMTLLETFLDGLVKAHQLEKDPKKFVEVFNRTIEELE